jgi:glycerol dehydrogenase-like iron-containing ADH family enzyme
MASIDSAIAILRQQEMHAGHGETCGVGIYFGLIFQN